MKPKNIIPTDIELILPKDRYIISTTDCSGRITGVSDLFLEYSGYSVDELLGQQHNISRHPDMPRAVFWLAWDMLLAGEEFNGYVKNLCKNGSYYWVFTNIRPVVNDSDEITGYRSVRRHPRPEAVAKAEKLYAEMLLAERSVPPVDAIEAGMSVLRSYLKQHGISYETMVATL